MADPSDNRVAVYIDFDNIVISRYDEVYGRGAFSKNKQTNKGVFVPDAGTDDDSKAKAARATVNVAAIIDYATSFGRVVISRGFADWSASANREYSRQLVDRAVDLTQLFPTAAYAKNGADIRLAVEVMEDLFRLSDITHVVIVAGDSDFIPLVQRVKRLGRIVVGVGVHGATSAQLQRACDEFRAYDQLPGMEPEPERNRVEPVKKTTQRRAQKAADDGADVEVVRDPQEVATDLLLRAIRQTLDKTDDETEWLHASSIKSLMLRLDGSFSEKALGFRSFSDFLKSRSEVVETNSDEAGGRVKLVEPPAA